MTEVTTNKERNTNFVPKHREVSNNKFSAKFTAEKRTGNNKFSSKARGARRERKDNKDNILDQGFESKVIEVKRVTRVVKGGKRMRFSAMVVVGDKNGQVGFGIKKGMDFQDAVAKATKKAKDNLVKVNLNDNKSVSFPSETKYKSIKILLKPADLGTGLIAGGFIRPVLELAGVENIYSKIIRSRNKFAGVQTVIKALENYK